MRAGNWHFRRRGRLSDCSRAESYLVGKEARNHRIFRWKSADKYATVLRMDEPNKDIQLDIEIEELHKKIDDLTDLVEDNHRMIRNLHQRARMATVFIFIKWFIIIGITIGSFYYIQPLIDNVVDAYSGFSGGSGADLFNLIKSI